MASMVRWSVCRDHLAEPLPGKPRQTLWRIYSRRAILAGGATERPIAFENNDRPGIMLAGSLRGYANRWGVTVGDKVAVFTNNADGLRTVQDLKAKGVNVVAVIDAREGDEVIDTSGRLGLDVDHCSACRWQDGNHCGHCACRLRRLESQRQHHLASSLETHVE